MRNSAKSNTKLEIFNFVLLLTDVASPYTENVLPMHVKWLRYKKKLYLNDIRKRFNRLVVTFNFEFQMCDKRFDKTVEMESITDCVMCAQHAVHLCVIFRWFAFALNRIIRIT